MADNRKYYYLKLKESYFDDDLQSFCWKVCRTVTLFQTELPGGYHTGKLQLDESRSVKEV